MDLPPSVRASVPVRPGCGGEGKHVDGAYLAGHPLPGQCRAHGPRMMERTWQMVSHSLWLSSESNVNVPSSLETVTVETV